MKAIAVAIDEKDNAVDRPRPHSGDGREFCRGSLDLVQGMQVISYASKNGNRFHSFFWVRLRRAEFRVNEPANAGALRRSQPMKLPQSAMRCWVGAATRVGVETRGSRVSGSAIHGACTIRSL